MRYMTLSVMSMHPCAAHIPIFRLYLCCMGMSPMQWTADQKPILCSKRPTSLLERLYSPKRILRAANLDTYITRGNQNESKQDIRDTLVWTERPGITLI